MNKFLFALVISVLLCHVSMAQKFGYIDSNYILKSMPAYSKAEQELNKYTEAWQKEIEDMHKQVETLKQEYRAEEVLLTEEMKQKRQSELAKKEAEVRDYQRKVFGYEGIMFKRRQELIRPIQDEIFTAVEKVAKAKGLQIVFDKSGDLVMIYTNPVHDYTEYVLEELGLAGEGQGGAKNRTGTVVDPTDSLPQVGDDGNTGTNENQSPAKPAPKRK
ncbi:OmpH family outer membrane protein [Botryobacter ruber]|uniref:OmpH family outer membrane protein n=1 Tax=Botryobacter ruber TaxID=2171629 RepID=UPI000E0A41A2|nr:OmpH family outer membrane protein [Botryobacter ruber]